ncbi:hypothetical protein Ciccas_009155, partial [Cichlidogyrus casuarinus]
NSHPNSSTERIHVLKSCRKDTTCLSTFLTSLMLWDNCVVIAKLPNSTAQVFAGLSCGPRAVSFEDRILSLLNTYAKQETMASCQI